MLITNLNRVGKIPGCEWERWVKEILVVYGTFRGIPVPSSFRLFGELILNALMGACYWKGNGGINKTYADFNFGGQMGIGPAFAVFWFGLCDWANERDEFLPASNDVDGWAPAKRTHGGRLTAQTLAAYARGQGSGHITAIINNVLWKYSPMPKKAFFDWPPTLPLPEGVVREGKRLTGRVQRDEGKGSHGPKTSGGRLRRSHEAYLEVQEANGNDFDVMNAFNDE